MNAVLCACLLCCGQAPKDDPLLRGLDEDFRALLKKEPNPQPLLAAAERLAQTNQNSRWTYYIDALATLRRLRSPAGIPLVLRYLVEHTRLSSYGGAEYRETFAILTGMELPEAPSPREAVAKFVKIWWTQHKDTVTTDLGKLPRERVEAIVERLLQRSAQATARYSSSDGVPEKGAAGVHALLGRSSYGDREPFAAAELHPRMVEMILARAGYDPKPKDRPPAREAHRVLFAGVRMLATLHNEGEAPLIGQVARDERQNSALRLTCVLALLEAGEDRQAPLLLTILEKEKKLDRRLTAVAALHYCDRHKETGPRLIALLDDPNAQVRSAALRSLQGTAPRAALPRLKKMLLAREPAGSLHTLLGLVAEIGNKEAQGTLAEFLAGELKTSGRNGLIYHVLDAFETATGQSWREAGAHDEAYYRGKAEEALKWWRGQQQ